MKISARLLAAIALVALGVGVMVSLHAEGPAEDAKGKPTKSVAHRTKTESRSPAETMTDLRSSNRGELRDWARGLEDGELRRLAMSFLPRLEESMPKEEEWEERARMRELLAALFMEWGRRDFAEVETALQGENLHDVAYPTAIAGLSETEPERALDLLAAWKGVSVDIMRAPVAMVATMHLARRDPEAAWERVKEGSGSIEGLAAVSEDLPALLEKLATHPLTKPPDDPFAESRADDVFLPFALGWARQDPTAAWEFVSVDYPMHDPFSNPGEEFLTALGTRDPAAAMDLAIVMKEDTQVGEIQREDRVMCALRAAFKSDPVAVIERMRRDGQLHEAGKITDLFEPGDFYDDLNPDLHVWPVLDQDRMQISFYGRSEIIRSRIPEFGLDEEEKIDLHSHLLEP